MQHKPLLIDLGGLSPCCTDHALEALAKSISGEDGQHDVWEPHHSPFLQALIEKFTARGLTMLGNVQASLKLWAEGKMVSPHKAPIPKPAPYVQNWSVEQAQLAHLYLTSLPADQFLFDDWSLLVDYLLHTLMPEEVLRTEAEWLAVRSSIMGRVQAHMNGKAISVLQLDPALLAMPLTVAGAQKAFNFGSKMDAVMEFGKARCAELLVDLSNTARKKIKRVILEHTFKKMQGDPIATKEVLQSKLFDEFATLNRDWRRIAVTEAGENANQGLIMTLTPGSSVKRIEQYKGACPFCKRIDGVVMKVVAADAPEKDGDKEVWPGKNNVGRSAAPRKRVGDELVERVPSELYWIPAGTVHPHCRGTWHLMPAASVHDDPDFQSWLDKHLHQNRASPTTGNGPTPAPPTGLLETP